MEVGTVKAKSRRRDEWRAFCYAQKWNPDARAEEYTFTTAIADPHPGRRELGNAYYRRCSAWKLSFFGRLGMPDLP